MTRLEEIDKRLDEITRQMNLLSIEEEGLKHERIAIRVKELKACKQWAHDKCTHLGGGHYGQV